jgi:hypothetical protein
MATIHFHCGTFKTGSSALQNALWAQREVLRAQGWLYPEIGVELGEPEVGQRHSSFVYRFHNGKQWNVLVERLLDEIDASACGNVVLSSEAWSYSRSGPSLNALMRTLRARGHAPMRGYLYLRNSAAYATAHYREFTVRRGNEKPFRDYVRAKRRTLDVLHVLAILRPAFKDNLAVARYEAVGDVVRDFWQRAGLPGPPEAAWRANFGINALETEGHRVLNEEHFGWLKEREAFPGALALLERAGVLLPDARVFGEKGARKFLLRDAGWRAKLAVATGWSDADVAAVADMPGDEPPLDIALLRPLLRRLVRKWIGAEGRLAARKHFATVRVLPHPAFHAIRFDVGKRADLSKGRLINGVAVLHASAPGRGRLLLEDARGDTDVQWDLATRAMKDKHPDSPNGGQARFRGTGLRLGAKGMARLWWVSPGGERHLLAEISRDLPRSERRALRRKAA